MRIPVLSVGHFLFIAVVTGATAHAEEFYLSLQHDTDNGKHLEISGYIDVDLSTGIVSDSPEGLAISQRNRATPVYLLRTINQSGLSHKNWTVKDDTLYFNQLDDFSWVSWSADDLPWNSLLRPEYQAGQFSISTSSGLFWSGKECPITEARWSYEEPAPFFDDLSMEKLGLWTQYERSVYNHKNQAPPDDAGFYGTCSIAVGTANYAVPEPSGVMQLVLVGLVGAGVRRRRA